jgi:hypothetical protein
VVEAISRYTQSTHEADVSTADEGWQRLRMVEPVTDGDWVIQPADATAYSAVLVLPQEFTFGWVYLLIHDSTGMLVVHQREDLQNAGDGGVGPQRFVIGAELPPMWLAAGLYTVHFKFFGRSASGVDLKYLSERRILDTRGWTNERANALLAPTCRWSLERVSESQHSESPVPTG